MITAEKEAPPLAHGDILTREEFMRRWELSPEIKRAELVDGVVYMPPPLAVDHGDMDSNLGGWAFVYKAATWRSQRARRHDIFGRGHVSARS